MECVFHCVEEFLCLILLQLGLWRGLFSFRLIASAYLDYGSGTTVDSGNFAIFCLLSFLRESNSRPSPYHGDALPTELRKQSIRCLPYKIVHVSLWSKRPSRHPIQKRSLGISGKDSNLNHRLGRRCTVLLPSRFRASCENRTRGLPITSGMLYQLS